MSWPRGTLADLFGDNVVYRNLEPQDARLAGLAAIWSTLGLESAAVPRKTTPEYARALQCFISQAQALRGLPPLERLLFIGDTAMNDGTAARNLGRYWPMRGFIGADRLREAPKVELDGDLMLANRWSALGEFARWMADEGYVGDERTALLIDLDKTSLGARGRNDRVIDAARVAAIQRTLSAALGDRFDEARFLAVYDPLNQPAYHPFTADNQDYLAYICLMVVAGIYDAERFWADLASGALTTLEQFSAACEAQRSTMSPALREAQDQLQAGLAAHDPTPFKTFRRVEYRETVARMDVLPDDASVADVLANEIVITGEVVAFARQMQARGVLLFAISDKPDEASTPTPEDAAAGLQPLHRTTMKIYPATLD
ncbi:MAG: hypothetical protein ABFD20_09285 [Anaerolineales bacterium]